MEHKLKNALAAKKQTVDKSKKLAASLVAAANKQFKDDSFATVASAMQASDVKIFVPSSIKALDVLVSGSISKGFPTGRIVELFGQEDTGKTTLGCLLLRNVQRIGGVAVLIDTEYTLTSDRIATLGIDADSLIAVNESSVEDIFERIVFILRRVGDRAPCVILWDTVAATPTKTERSRKFDEYSIAAHAIAMSRGLRRIAKPLSESSTLLVLCNQLREGSIGNMYAPEREKYATIGGKALKFHSTIRLMLELKKKLTVTQGAASGKKIPFGHLINAVTVKNKQGVPYGTALLTLQTRGVPQFNDAMSTLKTLDAWGVAKVNSTGRLEVNGHKLSESSFVHKFDTDINFRDAASSLLESGYKKMFKDTPETEDDA